MATGSTDVPSGATSWYCTFNTEILCERENYLNEINREERSAFLYNKMCCAGELPDSRYGVEEGFKQVGVHQIGFNHLREFITHAHSSSYP